MRRPYADMAFELGQMAGNKRAWLSKFSRGKNRRPEWNVLQFVRELEVIEQARDDYRRPAAKEANRSAA